MSKPLSYLGVDLSPDSIKLVELKAEKGKPQLVTYGYTESKANILSGDFISNKNITSTLLKEVADRAKVTTNFALAALPVAMVFSSVVRLPNLIKKELDNKQKIKAMLTDEVKKILPQPLEQMTFDFNIIKTPEIEQADRNAKLNVVRYLITAANNELIKNYLEIFNQAGFQLTNLDIEGFALIRSLVGNDKSLIMIIDIGENRTNLSIVNLTVPILNRSITVGSSLVTKSIADSLGIEIREAENYKMDLGIMMAQKGMEEFPAPVLEALGPIITEIKYLIKSYYDQMGTYQVLDKIILTGGGSLLGNYLDKYLTKILDIRTYVGDPWARVIYPEDLRPVLQEVGPRFSVAIGLAMREIV